MMRRLRLSSIITLATAAWLTSAIAQDLTQGTLDLNWHTIDGGGGTSTAGALQLAGTIGQPDATTTVLTGGDFELRGGFWAGGGEPIQICPPDLAPPGGDGLVNVQDMLAVINAWGACPVPPAFCPADIAPPGGNGSVNVQDMLAVINAWGACP